MSVCSIIAVLLVLTTVIQISSIYLDTLPKQ